MRRIGEVLIELGKVTREERDLALQEQMRTHELLGEVLVRQESISHRELCECLSVASGIPLVDLSSVEVNAAAVNSISKEIASELKLFPFDVNAEGAICVGMTNPFDTRAIDLLRQRTGKRIEVFICDIDLIIEAINKHFGVGAGLDEKIEKNLRALETGVDTFAKGEKEPPVICLINYFIEKAVNLSATDIHISPLEKATRVSYRVDGILQPGESVTKKRHTALVTRIKVMSGLNIAEQRLPQDGNISGEFAGRQVDIRVSTSPSDYGENVVLRLLHKSNIIFGLEKLGLSQRDEEYIQQLAKEPWGIILAAGPTGHGKTTTLYSMLKEIDATEKNVLTVEDPIEYRLAHIKQTQVNEKAGLTFARAIRHFLRQDPDVILVGEIRDPETAKIALQAAMTGHLVFSSIHTNHAVSCFARLLNLGIEAYLMDNLKAIVAQRLVRRICPHCMDTYAPSEKEMKGFDLQSHGVTELKRGRGCPRCFFKGYKGRTGIFEILKITDEIASMIFKRASPAEILAEARREGFHTMQEDGVAKAVAGITTLEEVERVVGKAGWESEWMESRPMPTMIRSTSFA